MPFLFTFFHIYVMFFSAAYLAAVKNETVRFEQNARQFLKIGEMQKAELMMNKKKFADKEVSNLCVKPNQMSSR